MCKYEKVKFSDRNSQFWAQKKQHQLSYILVLRLSYTRYSCFTYVKKLRLAISLDGWWTGQWKLDVDRLVGSSAKSCQLILALIGIDDSNTNFVLNSNFVGSLEFRRYLAEFSSNNKRIIFYILLFGTCSVLWDLVPPNFKSSFAVAHEIRPSGSFSPILRLAQLAHTYYIYLIEVECEKWENKF